MVNVNRSSLQGDAHLIEFPDGKKLLIDTGYRGEMHALLDLLAEKQIRRLDWILITHPHRDHYEGLLELVAREIQIGELFFNTPDPKRCNRERPWGCDFDHVTNTLEKIHKVRTPIRQATPGVVIHSFGKTRFRVLYAYTDPTSPIGPLDINDLSIIGVLEVGNTRALFTGDLNHPLGQWLATNDKNLKSAILKVPHHGTEGAAPNDFFAAVNPQVALIPSPKDLWHSDRSKRIREYFSGAGIPTFVNGINGNVTVRLNPNDFQVCPAFTDASAKSTCQTFQSRPTTQLP